MEILKRTDNTRTVVMAQVLRAAAEAIMVQGETVAMAVAGTEPAKFVQSFRQTYKTEGFNFSDDDLRTIHETVRVLCARVGLNRKQQMTFDDEREMMRMRAADKKAEIDAKVKGGRYVTTTPTGRQVH